MQTPGDLRPVGIGAVDAGEVVERIVEAAREREQVDEQALRRGGARRGSDRGLLKCDRVREPAFRE